jgi:hypothetical protein
VQTPTGWNSQRIPASCGSAWRRELPVVGVSARIYLAAIMPTQAKEAEKLDDVRITGVARELCGAYLVVAADSAQIRKKT